MNDLIELWPGGPKRRPLKKYRRTQRMRHTMGQDWGGRTPENPEGVPEVRREDVEEYARLHSFTIRKGWWTLGNKLVTPKIGGTWWYWGADGWYTGGATNYLMLELLKRAASGAHDRVRLFPHGPVKTPPPDVVLNPPS